MSIEEQYKKVRSKLINDEHYDYVNRLGMVENYEQLIRTDQRNKDAEICEEWGRTLVDKSLESSACFNCAKSILEENE